MSLLEMLKEARTTKTNKSEHSRREYEAILRRCDNPQAGDDSRILALMPILGLSEVQVAEDVEAAEAKIAADEDVDAASARLEDHKISSAEATAQARAQAVKAAGEVLDKFSILTLAQAMEFASNNNVPHSPEITAAARTVIECHGVCIAAEKENDRLKDHQKHTRAQLDGLIRHRPWLAE